MSKINIVLDLLKETQEFTLPEEDEVIDELCLSVNKEIDLSSFSFSISIYLESQVTFSGVFPPANVTLEKTDLDIIKHFDHYFLPERAHKVILSYKYNSKMYHSTFEVIGKKPLSPYPSWLWDTSVNTWLAPIPYPTTDDALMVGYEWDEERLEWSPLGGYEVV